MVRIGHPDLCIELFGGVSGQVRDLEPSEVERLVVADIFAAEDLQDLFRVRFRGQVQLFPDEPHAYFL